MENNQNSTTEAPKAENVTVIKKDPFALIGKLTLVIIVAAILLGGGYYIGNSNKSNTTNKTVISPTQSPTPSTITPSPSPAGAILKIKTVIAGGASGTSFDAYSIDLPTGWTENHEKTELTDKLTVIKEGYSIIIYQAPMGGGGCAYPGDPETPMTQKFTDFVNINGANYTLRRSWTKTGNLAGTIGYTVCQKADDNSYGSITSYGAISVKSPDPADPAIMKEVDFMISSMVQK